MWRAVLGLLAFFASSVPIVARASFLSGLISNITTPITDVGKVVVPIIGGMPKAAVQVVKDIPGVLTNAPQTLSQILTNPVQGAQSLLQSTPAQDYLKLISPANPQFLQVVMGIKLAKSTGLIKTNADCLQASNQAMGAAFSVTADPIQATMTQQIGNLACNDAIPPNAVNSVQNGVVQIQNRTLVNVPAGLPPIPPLPPQVGFGGLNYPTYPISVCQGPAFPGVIGSPILTQVILSNLVVLNATPTPGGIVWQPIAKMSMDGSGQFLLVAFNGPPWITAIAASGDVWRINTATGQAAIIGLCQ